MIRVMIKGFFALVFSICLSGCVSVLPEAAAPAPRYTISSVTPQSVPSSPVTWSLVVSDPTASQLFNTVKVPVMAAPNRFEFLAGSEWVDRVPVLFQRALVRTFENSGAITNVGDFTVLPVSDYVLRTDIRAFHADLTGETPTATIEIFARLIADDGKILTAQRFVARETARLDTPESLMPAFDRALNQVLGQITEWTFETVPAAREPGA